MGEKFPHTVVAVVEGNRHQLIAFIGAAFNHCSLAKDRMANPHIGAELRRWRFPLGSSRERHNFAADFLALWWQLFFTGCATS